ncbi:MAG: RnfABCDGE type electron transport complex subunit B [Planctomycetota bacterium]|nr:RnfABCDGE type electron transport complex subunit B [Planctomycetota bacterium]
MAVLVVGLAVVGTVVMSVLFGMVLGYASKKFYVEVDERITKIAKVLPGANCGGCGFAGCGGYAEAIVTKGAPLGRCSPGGSAVSQEIAKIMGQVAEEKEPEVAVVLCKGGSRSAKDRFDYWGVETCGAANLIGAGKKSCPVGCLGFGDCVRVCPFGAILMGEDGLPVVLRHLCKGCGKCVSVCPRGVLKLMPLSSKVVVRCRNTQKGATAKKACDFACIKCKKCEKSCKFEAVRIEKNIPLIDYLKCKRCGKCVTECPQGVIENYVKLDRKLFGKGKEGKEKEEEVAVA